MVAKQTGVAMLNGFSKNLLSVFLNEGGNRPVLVMSTKELVIYDRLICDELLIFQFKFFFFFFGVLNPRDIQFPCP